VSWLDGEEFLKIFGLRVL